MFFWPYGLIFALICIYNSYGFMSLQIMSNQLNWPDLFQTIHRKLLKYDPEKKDAVELN